MIRYRVLVTAVAVHHALFSSLSSAQDLSKYRNFQIGMSLDSVLKQTQMKATEVKVLHQRPALIQTLEWDQFSKATSQRPPTRCEAFSFDFYNGDLFKVVATYDPMRTEGLTTDDVIDAISLNYGKSNRLPSPRRLFPRRYRRTRHQRKGSCPLGENAEFPHTTFIEHHIETCSAW